jgi:hypothetical protein
MSEFYSAQTSKGLTNAPTLHFLFHPSGYALQSRSPLVSERVCRGRGLIQGRDDCSRVTDKTKSQSSRCLYGP